MNVRRLLPLGFGCVLLSGAVRAEQGGAYALKMKFPVGATNRYATTALISSAVVLQNGEQPPNTISVDMLQALQVRKALPGGGGEVLASTQEIKMLMDGKPYAAAPDANRMITTTYSDRGDILKIKGLGDNKSLLTGLLSAGTLNMQRVYLPSKPVKLGETWTQQVATPNLFFMAKGQAKTTFVKKEKVGRYETARLRSELTLPMKVLLNMRLEPTTDPNKAANALSGTLKMTFDSNFALTEGKVIRSAGSGGGMFTVAAIAPPKPKQSKSLPFAPQQALRLSLKMQVGNNLIE